MARFDVHRPSALKVEDYQFIKFDYLPSGGDILGDAMFLADERARFRCHMEKTGARYGENHSAGSCYICGAHAIYTATFHHAPTNSYIHTGLDCASALECGDAEAFRKKVKAGLEASKGKRKAKAVLESKGMGAAWELFEADIAKRAAYKAECDAYRTANPEPLASDPEYFAKRKAYEDGWNYPKWIDWGRDELTVLDMTERLIKYGSVSEKAERYMAALLERIAKAPEIAAQRAAEAAAAAPIPAFAGRTKIEGEVLTVKNVEGMYGVQVKMLVKHKDGWKLWGTVPASIAGQVAKGDTVSFVAAVTVSRDDKAFGFWSRPAQATVVKAAENIAA